MMPAPPKKETTPMPVAEENSVRPGDGHHPGGKGPAALVPLIRSRGHRGPQAEHKEAAKGSGKSFGPEASKKGFI